MIIWSPWLKKLARLTYIERIILSFLAFTRDASQPASLGDVSKAHARGRSVAKRDFV